MTQSLLDAPRTPSKRLVWIAGAAALLAHATAAGAATSARRAVGERHAERPVPLSQLIEVHEPRPPAAVEPEPPPLPQPAKAAAPKAAAASEPPPAHAGAAPSAGPAAAQAAQVLAQQPDDAVLDFGDTIVQGDSAAYAGGATEAAGASSKAVRDTGARAGGVEGGTGTDTSGVDRSRAASLAGGALWDCPFPEEADEDGIDQAVVTLRVRVAFDGTLEDVSVTEDPGSGFGREARRCARDKRWQPAHDRAGNAIASESAVRVRFSR